MKMFTSKINELYFSIGNFKPEFKDFLKSLTAENQLIFLQELYEDITLFGIEDKIDSEMENALVDGVDSFKFRFAGEDMETALESEKRTTERLFKSEVEGQKYRATYYFLERKKREVYFALNDVEKLYKSVAGRVPLKPSIDNLIGKIDFEFEWKPLSFPPKAFSTNKLKQFLRLENFRSCFYTDSHYDIFKSNSFTYFNQDEKHGILSIPIVTGKKNTIAKKFQSLYSLTSTFRADYNVTQYDYRRERFAKVIMANFIEYRKNTIDTTTFQSDLKTTLSRMR